MKFHTNIVSVLFLSYIFGALSLFQFSFAFTTPSLSHCDRGIIGRGPVSGSSYSNSNTQLFFFGGKAKDDDSPGDYVCKDCGYVFTKGPKAWGKLNDSYGCPPCGSPKFRFKKVPKGSESGKVTIKKGWFD